MKTTRVSRRRFVSTAAQAAAWCGGIALTGGRAMSVIEATAPVSLLPIAHVTSQTFAPHVGTAFDIRAPGGKLIRSVLTRVTPLPRHGRLDTFRDPFVVTFAVPPGAETEETIVDVQHSELGRFEVFVRPCGKKSTPAYEAVFG